jgi:FMN-dependent NADH-azoreductase
MNHLGPHIKVVSKYLGVDTFYEIRSEYQEFGDQRHIDSLDNARAKITELIADLM